MKTIQVQPSCRPQQLPHTCCKAAASSLQSAQKHTQDCGTHTHARNCILQQYFSPLISGLDSIFSKTILLVAVFYLPDASHHLHAAVLLSVCLCLCVCESVSVCVCMRWRGFTAVRARLRRLKRRRRSAASLPACWRYVTAPSCRCQAPLPP